MKLRTATGEQAGTQESTDPSTPSGLKLRLTLQVSTVTLSRLSNCLATNATCETQARRLSRTPPSRQQTEASLVTQALVTVVLPIQELWLFSSSYTRSWRFQEEQTLCATDVCTAVCPIRHTVMADFRSYCAHNTELYDKFPSEPHETEQIEALGKDGDTNVHRRVVAKHAIGK